MPLKNTLKTPYQPVHLVPGHGYLDQDADETVREDLAYRTLRNARLEQMTLARRDGMRRVHVFTDKPSTNGSWTFGAVTKFATVATTATHLVPVGGWFVHLSFTAVWPAAGKTGYIFSIRKTGEDKDAIAFTISDAGVITGAWRKESDESSVASIASTAVSDGATVHLLYGYDPVAGTTRMYINGPEDGTAVTGLAATLQPMQDAETWYFGVRSDGAGGEVADTHFSGKIDAFCLYSLRGLNPTAARPGGTRTWLSTRREDIYCEEACPWLASVLACYDFNESSGVVLTDRSRFKNNGVLTGSPTSTAAVAYPAENGNLVRVFQGANGKRTNVAARGGDLFSEVTRSGSS